MNLRIVLAFLAGALALLVAVAVLSDVWLAVGLLALAVAVLVL